MRKHLRPVCVALLLVVAGCDREPIVVTAPTPAPTPAAPPAVPAPDRIEYRVQGALLSTSVTIRYSDPAGGVTLITTTVPFSVTTTNTDASAFLFVEASAFGFSTSTLQAQIFVNGRIFREASSVGSTLFAQASGTIALLPSATLTTVASDTASADRSPSNLVRDESSRSDRTLDAP